ncbi:MAG TPA: hypothetical protein VOA64_03900 [Candidatus Dormibacteraeota bacterium]|nr:hypothetical protein [Candidatus Dormibacteraeota bacterium]
MAEDTFLSDDLLRQLMSVGEVDLLVGITSHSSAQAIRQAMQVIEQSFQQNFVRQRVVIVNIDGGGPKDEAEVSAGNSDGQPEGNPHVPILTSLRTVHHVTARFSGTPSQGTALRTVLAASDLLQARACAIVSPTTSNLTPQWIANLLRPAYRDNFDFVAPLYTRHKYQGLLARILLYPMSRAVFGKRIRELFADEWGFSGRLGTHCLNQNVWHEAAIHSRPEAWMAVSAISSDYRCCQAFLGPKPQPPTGSGPDIVEAIRQTVGTFFWCLETRAGSWLEREGSEPVPTFGPEHELTSEPVELNLQRMFELFCSGVKELEPILSTVLERETHAEIMDIVAVDAKTFRFGADLWVRTLYDFASSYHHQVMNRDHLVQALVPLYRGKIYSFLQEHANSSPEEMEEANERLCLEFERQKLYLRERWTKRVEVKV